LLREGPELQAVNARIRGKAVIFFAVKARIPGNEAFSIAPEGMIPVFLGDDAWANLPRWK
jgi:hypothetical protein